MSLIQKRNEENSLIPWNPLDGLTPQEKSHQKEWGELIEAAKKAIRDSSRQRGGTV